MTRRLEKGFTVLEVLIALTVLSVALIAIAGLAGTAMKSTETGKRRTQAVNLAVEKMESLKAIPYTNIQSTNGANLAVDGYITRSCTKASNTPPTFNCTPTPSIVTKGGMEFTWNWQVIYVNLDNDANVYSLDPAIDSGDIKEVIVTVTWTDLFGAHSVRLPTLRRT